MRRVRIATAAAAAALIVSVVSREAAALSISMEPAAPVAKGQTQTFRIANVADAVGQVALTWNFGDGSPTTAGSEMVTTHAYHEAGHYTVIVLASDDATRTSASFVQTVFHPPAARPPSNSSSIIIDAARHRVWNVNPDSGSVSVIDADRLTRVREVPVGRQPRALAQAPNGTVWVTNQMSDDIAVLDRDTGAVLSRVALPYASQPRAIAFGPGGRAYVSLYATGKLVEIDSESRKVVRDVALGPTPAGVSVAPDGRIFVTRFLSPADHGEVWVVSSQTLALTNTVILPFDQGPDTQSSGRGVPNYVSSAVISPDGTQAWVSSKKDNVARGLKRDGLPTTADNFVRSAVCTIDLATEKEVLERRQDIDNRSMPVSVAFSPLGDYAFVLVLTNNWIGIMDAYSAQGLSGIKNAGNAPDGMALASDGKLFVNAALSREVIVYDVNPSLSSLDHSAPEPQARIRAIDDEPLSAQLLLGKQIFHNAADTRMGHAGYWSCASCHLGGVSDGRIWDFSDRGEGLRNTKSLLGIRGGQGQGRVHWSGNFDEIQDFERDIRDSFLGSGFMADVDYDARKGPSGVYDSFGTPAAGVSADLDALAAYVTSFTEVQRSPFRNPDGSFTKAALEGRKVFLRAGCGECHYGPDFTDSPQGALHDVGTLLPTSGTRLGGPLMGIDTPTLKGLWQSAPYLHDGRADTLMEIFTKYITDDKMGKTSDLTPTELEQMVEYLLELDDVPEVVATGDASQGGCTAGACSVEVASPSPFAGKGKGLVASLLAWTAVTAIARRRRRRHRGN